MTINEIKDLLLTSDYNFLRENPNLSNNLIFLTLGGSYAYGTNIESSDIDIRGCGLNSANEILLGEDYGVITDRNTDTVIYSFNKLIQLLINVNPNTIEMLGLRPEHYLKINNIGRELVDNKKLFLSKKAFFTFGSYANQQLWRLNNKAVRSVSQSEREKHILKSIEHCSQSFKERYFEMPNDSIKLYVDNAVNEEWDKEIFMDINLSHYPLRDYKSMWSEMNNIVKEYNKIGGRNKKAAEHGKLAKHMMHLVRLYLMCFDILEKEEINTYRENEHDFLMEIRNGKFLDKNEKPIPEFFDYVKQLEERLEYDKNNTSLPDQPDYNKIREFQAEINKKVILEEF